MSERFFAGDAVTIVRVGEGAEISAYPTVEQFHGVMEGERMILPSGEHTTPVVRASPLEGVPHIVCAETKSRTRYLIVKSTVIRSFLRRKT